MKYPWFPLFLLFLVLYPGHVWAQNRYTKTADEAFIEQKYSTAILRYQKAFSKVKKNKDERDRISFQMAECYRLMNNTKRAEYAYKRLVNEKYIAKTPSIHVYYADMLKTNGKYDEAIEQYNAYLEKFPDDEYARQNVENCMKAKEWMENPSKYAVTVEKKLSSREDDFAPAYADKNFSSLLFTSNREASTGKTKDNWTGMDFTDLYFSRKDKKDEWSTPVLLDQEENLNTESNEGVGQFNSRFTTLYFTRCWKEATEKNGCAIYKISRTGGTSWSEPQMVDIGGDSSYANGHPTVSTDESMLIFSSDRPGGLGGKDLWISKKKKKEEGVTRPVNMGEVINTPGDEMFPFLRNDTILYFASNGHPGMGGLDIFQSVYSNGDWGAPENLRYPVNSFADDFGMVFNLNEPEEGFFTSSRPGGRGKDDIYFFIIPPVYFTLTGVITDDLTLQPVQGAAVQIIGSNGKTAEYNTDERGNYSFNKNQVLPNTTYEIIVTKKDYFIEKATETTVGFESSRDLIHDFTLRPIPKKPVVLPDILYDLARWDLKPQFQDSLQGLIATLDANENLVIELASHTDTRDTEERNDILSQKRAQSVVDYLITRGIDPDRLVAKGYGERVPRNLGRNITREGYTFVAGTVITDSLIETLPSPAVKEAAHQLNRRTEFSILRNDFIPKQKIAGKEKPTIEVVVEPEENSVPYTLDSNEDIQFTGYINGITMTFTYDPAEKDLFISPGEALKLLQNGAIDKNDFEGDVTKSIGEGFIADKSVINIREIRIGRNIVKDIKVTVNQRLKTSVLLGKNTLEKIGKFAVDQTEMKIIFE
jgi:peptidoglycan-associated lipoprotein